MQRFKFGVAAVGRTAVLLASLMLTSGWPGAQARPQGATAKSRHMADSALHPSVDHPFQSAEYIDKRGRHWSVVKARGVTVFGILAGAGGYTRDRRAQLISARMDRLYTHQVPLAQKESYQITQLNHETTLCIHNPEHTADLPEDVLILTIDSVFAQKLGRKREDIGAYWRDLMIYNLKEVKIKGDPLSKPLSKPKDMLGRPLDPDATWLDIPPGYAAHAQ